MMLRRILLGAAAMVVAVSPVAAEPITLKLNSPAPPMSYLHREVITPWAETVRLTPMSRRRSRPSTVERWAASQHL